MSEFKRYVERLDEVEAFQFVNADQAQAIVDIFASGADWVVRGNWPKGTLSVEFASRPTPENKVAVEYVIHRGDFIVREPYGSALWFGDTYRVVGAAEFREKYREAVA